MSSSTHERDKQTQEFLERYEQMPEDRQRIFRIGLERVGNGQSVYEAFSEFVPEYLSESELREITKGE